MGLRILLVEDDPNIRMVAETSLTFGSDNEVVEVENGKKALELLREKDNNFDIILLDVMMPEMNGFTALSQIKTDPKLRHIPVAMLTAMAQKADIERSIELGADGYIEKPFDPINLPKQVEDIYKRCKKGE